MQNAVPIRVQVGAFELDLKAGELRKDGARVRLQEQPFQILLMLVERSGEVVNREEMKRKLWPNDTVVEFDQSIHTAINKLRRALGDSAEQPEYVETVGRRGYRLLVPVQCLESSSGDRAGALSFSPEARGWGTSTSLVGKKVSHYRVLEIIGGGGMGLVYKAEDLKLGRRVALKFLPEELASEPVALQRFEREARTASSLNHPNICTIHEVEEHEGQPFIVMELLEGETLRDRLAAATSGEKPIPLDELLRIAVQVADGLEAAHETGIIHRDIKPANIFLTKKGTAKILDFGLAKLATTGEDRGEHGRADLQVRVRPTPLSPSGLQPATPMEHTLTRTGAAMGTAGYMSPEQVRGEKLDARTDLFSFGLVLYEMATGQRAFTGNTAPILKDAILSHTPVPVRELNSTLPGGLAQVIGKAIEKERERRYQSAEGMRLDLETVSLERQPTVTKSRVRRRWMLLATSLVALAVGITAVFYSRTSRATKLAASDSIVLADFNNSTGEDVFDGSLKQALAIHLEQSPLLNVLSERKVNGVLKQMNRTPNERLTPELAREVCLRTKSKALLAGSIGDVGDRYRIELQAVDCGTAKVMQHAEAEAENRNKILPALQVAADQMRAKLGEPADSISKFSNPIEEASSSSLEALKTYRQGRITQGVAERLPYFKRAVELDPKFAIANLFLGDAYHDIGEESLAKDSYQKAFDLRDRVSERSRFFLEATYYAEVTGELEKAVSIYNAWIQVYPGDSIPHNDLGVVLGFLGRWENAAAEERETLRITTGVMEPFYNLMTDYLALNRLDEASATFEDARSRQLDASDLHRADYVLAFLRKDENAMRQQVEWATGKPEVEPWLLSYQSNTHAYYGQFSIARAHSQKALNSARRSGAFEIAATVKAMEALRYAEVGDAASTRQATREAFALSSARMVTVLAALALARAGDVVDSDKLEEKINQEFSAATTVQSYLLPTILASVELHRGNAQQALAILAPTTKYELANFVAFDCGPLYPAYVRGLAYLKLGHGHQAAAEFQKLVDHRGLVGNFVLGALAHLQLGRAQVMMGDKAAARKSYQDFLTLWKDADPDIPIYQQAKAEYAKLR